jgi:uncharacterized protein YkwD
MVVVLTATACGVPISAEEMASGPLITPEAESEAAQTVTRSIAVTQDATLRTVLTEAGADGDTFAASLSTESVPEATPLATETPEPTSVPETPVTTTATREAVPTPTPAALAPQPTALPASAATPLPAGSHSSEMSAQAVSVLNDYRDSLGLRPLTVDPQLTLAADRYAKLMADTNWWSCRCDVHTGPDGSSPGGRLAAAGFTGRFAGEALAGGQATGQDVITMWLNSPPHRAIVLSASATHIGIGYYFMPGHWPGQHWVLLTGVR